MQNEFIQSIYKPAMIEMEKHGILASITIAQAILESGWGKSELALNAFNLFGIKGEYNGQSYEIVTNEFVNGEMIQVKAKFKKYPSYDGSMEDHSIFLLKDRYAKVIGEKDYRIAASELQKAGYATDPQYPQKLITLIETYNLHEFDQIKQIGGEGEMKIVTLDPGHGGTDPGAIGNGINEKDIVLNLALKVKKYLEKYENVTVKMTRSTDVFVSLADRVKITNANNTDLFVSLHNNSFGTETANGFESYVWSSAVGTTTKNARTKIHSEIYNAMKANTIVDRGEKFANFQVLGCIAPAVLLEYLFISNTKESTLLKSDAFLEKIAEATAKGIANALGLKLKATTPPPTNDIFRVRVNGVQVGAYGTHATILALVESELKKSTAKIEIEKV